MTISSPAPPSVTAAPLLTARSLRQELLVTLALANSYRLGPGRWNPLLDAGRLYVLALESRALSPGLTPLTFAA